MKLLKLLEDIETIIDAKKKLEEALNKTSPVASKIFNKLKDFLDNEVLEKVLEECKKDKEARKLLVDGKLPLEGILGGVILLFIYVVANFLQYADEQIKITSHQKELFILALLYSIYVMFEEKGINVGVEHELGYV